MKLSIILFIGLIATSIAFDNKWEQSFLEM